MSSSTVLMMSLFEMFVVPIHKTHPAIYNIDICLILRAIS